MPFKNPVRGAKSRFKYRLQRDYGITVEKYEKLLISQSGRCALCGNSGGIGSKHRNLGVDHDHETGKVRGLLCHPCNIRLGYIESNTPDFMQKVEVYLAQGTADETNRARDHIFSHFS